MRFLMMVILVGVCLAGCSSPEVKSPIYIDPVSGKGMFGYDPVSFMGLYQDPTKGKLDFSTEYDSVTWLFASQNNVDRFLSEPESFVPRYGGYCVNALAEKNVLVPGDPERWFISGSRLYLLCEEYDRYSTEEWIKKANENWAEIFE